MARHPQIFGARSLEVQDCNGSSLFCSTISTSPDPINTGDPVADMVQNHTITAYNFFFNEYGRDSIDDEGMKLVSRIHYRIDYNNTFYDGTNQFTYGDGDGECFVHGA